MHSQTPEEKLVLAVLGIIPMNSLNFLSVVTWLLLSGYFITSEANGFAGLLILNVDKEKERAGLTEEKAWVWRDLDFINMGWTIPSWSINGPRGEIDNLIRLMVAFRSYNMNYSLNLASQDAEFGERSKSFIDFSQRPLKMNIYFGKIKTTLQLFNEKRKIDKNNGNIWSYPFALASKGNSPGRLKIWIDEQTLYEDEGRTDIEPIFERGIKVHFKSVYSVYPPIFNNVQATASEVEQSALFYNNYNFEHYYEGVIVVAQNIAPPYGCSVLLVKSRTVGRWTMFPKVLGKTRKFHFSYENYSDILPQLTFEEFAQRRSGFSVLQSKVDGKHLLAAIIKVELEYIPNIPTGQYRWMNFVDVYGNRESLLDSYSLCLFGNLYNEYAMKVPLLPVIRHVFVVESVDGKPFIWMDCNQERCIFPIQNNEPDEEFLLEKFGFVLEQTKGKVVMSVIDNEQLVLEDYVGFTSLSKFATDCNLKRIDLEELLYKNAARETVSGKCMVRFHSDEEHLVDIPWIFNEVKFVECLYALRFSPFALDKYQDGVIIKDTRRYRLAVSAREG